MSDHGRAHALLSPSSAERWITCPASVRLIESLDRSDDGGSEWAEEGTRAHSLAEIEAAYEFGLTTHDEYRVFRAAWLQKALDHDDDIEEMEGHVATYVSMLQDAHAGLSEDGAVTVRLEVRVQTGVPGCWGTADAVLIGRTRVVVIDFKYGQGVRVHVHRNPQLMLYGVGVLELVDLLGTITHVDLGICQPRVSDGLSMWGITAASLREWRDHEAQEAAQESQREDARFGPSETACRWCPASGVCKPRLLHITQKDFGNPDLMDAEELADSVLRIEELRDWCKAVEAEALHQAYSEGKTLPGLKVVMSGGKRSIKDKEAAIERLVAAGFDRDKVTRADTQTLGQLEKIVGKARLPEILGDALNPGKGSPSLVAEDDPREAISPTTEAGKDFQPSEG